jgi:hypothetical protein
MFKIFLRENRRRGTAKNGLKGRNKTNFVGMALAYLENCGILTLLKT